jgi:hypothetical protein
MKLQFKVGSTSQTINVMIYNSTTGLPLTGLVYNSSGLTAYYALPLATSNAISLVTQTVTGAWSSGGFKEIDSTHMPGLYRLDIPDASIASGNFSNIILQGAANMAACAIEIQLIGYDNTATYVPSNVQQISGDSTAATNLSLGAEQLIFGYCITGTLSTTQATTSLGSANTDQYKGRTIIFTSGTNTHVTTTITGFDGTNKLTFTALPTGAAPANGDNFIIV